MLANKKEVKAKLGERGGGGVGRSRNEMLLPH